MTYDRLCDAFKTWLAEIAAEYGKTVEQVFGWWQQYATDCQNFDQSPVQSEFLAWYRAELQPPSL